MTAMLPHRRSDKIYIDSKLLATIRSDEDWKPQASCRNSDPDAWFPGEKDTFGARQAIAICNNCPVQAQCLAYALAHGEHNGVWGGVFMEDPIQRRRLSLSKPLTRGVL